MKPILDRRIVNVALGSWRSADSSSSVSISLCRSYITAFIILVNEGFVKRFIIFAYQLTKIVVDVGVVKACIYAV